MAETLTERLKRTEQRLSATLKLVLEIRDQATRKRRGTDGKKYLLNDLMVVEALADQILREG